MHPNRRTAWAQARMTGWLDGVCGARPPSDRYNEMLLGGATHAQLEAALELGNWYTLGHHDGQRDRATQAVLSALLTEEA